jgi:type VI secretion system protein ImpH
VRIVLGPLSREQYLDFLPGGFAWEPLQAWLRFFSNQELDFEIQPVLRREHVPACELGCDDASLSCLGWTSWLRSAPFTRDADETILMTKQEDACLS